LTKFFRHGTVVGAVTPSSRWLARAMLRDIDLTSAGCIVELGAGTGAITAELFHRPIRCGRLILVERDADFCRRLEQRFPQAEVVQADARELETILHPRGVERVDHILCGLALPWFSPANRHRILDASRRLLTRTGSFRQLTYMPWIHTHVYRRYFEQVRFRFVCRNLPPGGCYVCRHPVAGTVPQTPSTPQ
jgi:phospholipid N-methyltransferase